MNKFWNVKTDGQNSNIDLFGFVGGSKEYNDGFNEEDFLKEIRSIPAKNKLNIAINSFGGSVFTALSIYAILKEHKGAITFRIDGVAMSAATIITSVPNAKVIIPKGAMMMIHKVSSVAMGTADDMKKAADDMEKLEDNIIAIYAEKTGKDVKEIKAKVNAETYFTAEEAVEFGLADEIDNEKSVVNSLNGSILYANGYEMDAKFFANAPEGFFKLPETDAENEASEINSKEGDTTMTLEELKANCPELVEIIRNEAIAEGVMNERERIKAIEEIAIAGHEELVNNAKFDTAMTAEQLAVAILKANKAKNDAIKADREADAEAVNEVATDDGNTGVMPDAEQQAKNDAERKEFIAAAVAGFNNRKK